MNFICVRSEIVLGNIAIQNYTHSHTNTQTRLPHFRIIHAVITFNRVDVTTPITTMGDSAICAFFIAVIVLVSGAPRDTQTAPQTPDRRATASAAKTVPPC